LAGSGTATKSGEGLVVLNSPNALSGSFHITAGSLWVTTPDALTTGSVTVSGAATALNLGDTAQNVGAFRLVDGAVSAGTLGASRYVLENGSFGAQWSGSGEVTKTTAGLVTLSGSNTLFSGPVRLEEGTVRIDVDSALGASGSITFAGGTLLYGSGVSLDLSSRLSVAAGSVALLDIGRRVTWARRKLWRAPWCFRLRWREMASRSERVPRWWPTGS
jgi:autotransporter-associated beta strand protein